MAKVYTVCQCTKRAILDPRSCFETKGNTSSEIYINPLLAIKEYKLNSYRPPTCVYLFCSLKLLKTFQLKVVAVMWVFKQADYVNSESSCYLSIHLHWPGKRGRESWHVQDECSVWNSGTKINGCQYEWFSTDLDSTKNWIPSPKIQPFKELCSNLRKNLAFLNL